MRTPSTSTAEFFERKYRQVRDPWDFASSPYELDRYARIIAALKDRHYKNAFEPGCSIGVLTEHLASLTDHLLAVDFSPSASSEARNRCSRFTGVDVRTGSLASGLALGNYDLIVLCEIGYYFTSEDWEKTVQSIRPAMQPPAVLLAAHWLGESKDHELSGDVVHEILNADVGLPLEYSERHDMFRLDRWVYA